MPRVTDRPAPTEAPSASGDHQATPCVIVGGGPAGVLLALRLPLVQSLAARWVAYRLGPCRVQSLAARQGRGRTSGIDGPPPKPRANAPA